jgi:hypothetical protein
LSTSEAGGLEKEEVEKLVKINKGLRLLARIEGPWPTPTASLPLCWEGRTPLRGGAEGFHQKVS